MAAAMRLAQLRSRAPVALRPLLHDAAGASRRAALVTRLVEPGGPRHSRADYGAAAAKKEMLVALVRQGPPCRALSNKVDPSLFPPRQNKQQQSPQGDAAFTPVPPHVKVPEDLKPELRKLLREFEKEGLRLMALRDQRAVVDHFLQIVQSQPALLTLESPYYIALHSAKFLRDEDTLQRVFEVMQRFLKPIPLALYNQLLKAASFLPRAAGKLNMELVLEHIMRSGQKPDGESFRIIMQGYKAYREYSKVFDVWQAMMKVGVLAEPAHLSLLVKTAARTKNREAVNEVYRYVRRPGAPLDTRLRSELVTAFLRLRQHSELEELVADSRQGGKAFEPFFYHKMLRVAAMTRSRADARRWYSEALNDQNLMLRQSFFAFAVRVFASFSDVDQLWAVFSEMRMRGMPVDSRSAAIMLDRFSFRCKKEEVEKLVAALEEHAASIESRGGPDAVLAAMSAEHVKNLERARKEAAVGGAEGVGEQAADEFDGENEDDYEDEEGDEVDGLDEVGTDGKEGDAVDRRGMGLKWTVSKDAMFDSKERQRRLLASAARALLVVASDKAYDYMDRLRTLLQRPLRELEAAELVSRAPPAVALRMLRALSQTEGFALGAPSYAIVISAHLRSRREGLTRSLETLQEMERAGVAVTAALWDLIVRTLRMYHMDDTNVQRLARQHQFTFPLLRRSTLISLEEVTDWSPLTAAQLERFRSFIAALRHLRPGGFPTGSEGGGRTTMFVANVPYFVSEQELRSAFEPVAQVTYVRMHRNEEKRFKGSAHVSFATRDAAKAVMAAAAEGKIILHGRVLRIEESRGPTTDTAL